MNEVGFGRATYPSGRVCRHSGHYIRKTLLEINTMLAVISGVLRRCSRPRHSCPAAPLFARHPRGKNEFGDRPRHHPYGAPKKDYVHNIRRKFDKLKAVEIN